MSIPAKHSVSASRNACLAIFFICGIGLSSWAPLVPITKSRLELTESELGLILLALGSGAIAMMPVTAFLINRFGSRRVILFSAFAIAGSLPLLAIAPNSWLLAALLFVFGAGIGSIDVAMNAQAVAIQDRYGKAIMSSFHGLFSVGGIVGALGLGALMDYGFDPLAATCVIAALLLVIVLFQSAYLLPPDEENQEEGEFTFQITNRSVLFLGCMCFVFFMAEGSVLDWSAVFLQDERGFSAAWSGIGYAGFSIAMAVMRLTGDRIVQKTGSLTTVVLGAFIAATGFFIAILIPFDWAIILGFVLIGLGAANVVPIFFTAAGSVPGVPTSVALSSVTILGYTGQLMGPALVGFIADASSLPIALGVVGCLVLLTIPLALKQLRPQPQKV